MKRVSVKLIAAALALCLLLPACGDSGEQASPSADTEVAEPVEISLWTYPVGGWGNSGTVSSLLGEFHRKHPGIRVSVKCLDYETGDSELEEAIAEGRAPDLVLEGPERLVAGWGVRGLMADLSDLWSEEPAGEIYDTVEEACHDSDGRYYIYPLCMTTHCMAINRDLFESSGAWKYVDEKTHTWSTDDFFAAVAALRDAGVEDVAAVYCGGQGGDQGTRALVTNLCGGSFTDPAHTVYTVDSPENIRALELLAGTEGIRFDPTLLGADELELFGNGKLAMSFCWNVFMEINQTVSNPNLNFDIFPMAFPTDSGEPRLQGGIWGFGIFDNGDEERIAAAKEFIRSMTSDSDSCRRAVIASTYWPVRELDGIYEGDRLMQEYGIFGSYLGDYYQVTPNWTAARTAWWKMLQSVGAGIPPEDAVKAFTAAVSG